MEKRPKNVSDIVSEFEERLGGFIATQSKRDRQDKDNEWLRTQISSLLEAKIEEMEGEKRAFNKTANCTCMDGDDECFCDTRIDAHNEAITRAQSILKEALV